MKSNKNYKVLKPATNNEPATIEIIPEKKNGGNVYKDEPIPRKS